MQVSDDFYKQRFQNIQVLRGLAALLVIMEHIRFLQCGAFGVDIFFCISGFMVMYSTHHTTQHFLRKRMIRIVPFYYLMTILTFFLLLLFPGMFEQTVVQFSYLVKSLLFIPFYIVEGAIQPLFRIGWTINCEMFFFLLFFLSLRISHRYRGVICSLLLVGVVVINKGVGLDHPIVIFYGDPMMLEFLLGILTYYLVCYLYRFQMSAWVSYLFALIGCVLLGILIITRPGIDLANWNRLVLWGGSAMLIVLAFFMAERHTIILRPLANIGNISFSIYLLHYYFILFVDRSIISFASFSPQSLIAAGISCIIVVLSSYVAYHLIEVQFTHWLQSRLLPMNQRYKKPS